MRKISTLFLVILLISITGCTKETTDSLDNDYFDNTTTESMDQITPLMNRYFDKLSTFYFEDNHSLDRMYDITEQDDYQILNLGALDTLTRENFLNYDLVSEKNYMQSGRLGSFVHSIWKIQEMVQGECANLEEGTTCTIDSYSISFLADDKDLLLYVENNRDSASIKYEVLLGENSNSLMTANIQVVYEVNDEATYIVVDYIEGKSEKTQKLHLPHYIDEPSTDGTYEETFFNIETNEYYYLVVTRAYKTLGVFSPSTDSYEEIRYDTEDEVYDRYSITTYIEDAIKYSYMDNFLIYLNLMEFTGWEELRIQDNSIYYMYDSLGLMDNLYAKRNDYPYIEDTFSAVTANDFFLKFNALSPTIDYDFFIQKEMIFIAAYNSHYATMGNDLTYTENYTNILDKFNGTEESE